MATSEKVFRATMDFRDLGMTDHLILQSGGNNFYAGLHAALQKRRITEQELLRLDDHLHRHTASDEKELASHVAKAEATVNKTGNAMLAYRELREAVRQKELPIARPWRSKLLLSAALAGAITGGAIRDIFKTVHRHMTSN